MEWQLGPDVSSCWKIKTLEKIGMKQLFAATGHQAAQDCHPGENETNVSPIMALAFCLKPFSQKESQQSFSSQGWGETKQLEFVGHYSRKEEAVQRKSSATVLRDPVESLV